MNNLDQKFQNNAVNTKEGKLILDSHKLSYHYDRVEAWENGERVAPVSVDMALTRACGAMCSFCYAMVQEPQERSSIKVKQALDLVDDFAEIGIKGVSLISDGESTLSKAYVPFIQHADKSGIDVGLAGNIGDSFSKTLLSGDKEVYVLEISSFQLDDIKKFKPNISVITNIIEDHLDRYDNDFSKYVDAKMKITMNQDESDYLIYNSDDKALIDVLKNKKLPVNKISIGIKNSNQNQVLVENNILSNKKKLL